MPTKFTKRDLEDIEEIRQRLGPTEPVPGPAFAAIDEHLSAISTLLQQLLATSPATPQAISAWAMLRAECIEATDVRPPEEKWTNYPKPETLSAVE